MSSSLNLTSYQTENIFSGVDCPSLSTSVLKSPSKTMDDIINDFNILDTDGFHDFDLISLKDPNSGLYDIVPSLTNHTNSFTGDLNSNFYPDSSSSLDSLTSPSYSTIFSSSDHLSTHDPLLSYPVHEDGDSTFCFVQDSSFSSQTGGFQDVDLYSTSGEDTSSLSLISDNFSNCFDAKELSNLDSSTDSTDDLISKNASTEDMNEEQQSQELSASKDFNKSKRNRSKKPRKNESESKNESTERARTKRMPKTNRKCYAKDINDKLMESFQRNRNISKEEKVRLAEETGLNVSQISTWFYRQKWSGLRKEHRRILEESFQRNENFTEEEKTRLVDVTGLKRQLVEDWLWEKTVKQNKKFTVKARKTLIEYFLNKQDFSPEEKNYLSNITGLSVFQISQWVLGQQKKRRYGTAEEITKLLQNKVQCGERLTNQERIKLELATGLSGYQINKWIEHKQGPMRGLGKEVRKKLERKFAQKPNLSKAEKKALALELDLEFQQVSRWFYNRKTRPNKKNRDRTMQEMVQLQMDTVQDTQPITINYNSTN